jgi:hypothetical protein
MTTEILHLMLRAYHDDINITSGIEKMSLPNFKRASHGSVTFTSGVEQMPLPD